MHPRVAYVTHRGSAPPDPDISVALAGLESAGLDAQTCAWDGHTEWDEFDLVLVRSPWDHATRRQDFLRWARRVEGVTRLANSAVTFARNTDRTYLRDLHGHGLPVVDTVWFEPGDDPDTLASQIRARGWQRCTVRPHVGTGGAGVEAVDGPEEAAVAAHDLAVHGAVAMVRNASWSGHGRRLSVVMLGGRVSHAVLTSDDRGPTGAAVETDRPEPLVDLAASVHAVAAAGEELLYARIDLIDDEDQWVLGAFEATDPCLFLEASPDAAVRLGHTVREWIMPEAQAADFLVGSG